MQIKISHDPRIAGGPKTDCVVTVPLDACTVLMMPYKFNELAERLLGAHEPPTQIFNAYETLLLMVVSLSFGVYIGAKYGH